MPKLYSTESSGTNHYYVERSKRALCLDDQAAAYDLALEIGIIFGRSNADCENAVRDAIVIGLAHGIAAGLDPQFDEREFEDLAVDMTPNSMQVYRLLAQAVSDFGS
jgi:hypothetical protein